MPWVDKDRCIGCGICVDECPVDIIFLEDDIAGIDMTGCIHCGKCHDVCSEDAVRHDSEKTPDRIKANIEQIKKFMDDCEKYLGNKDERGKCLTRMKKHFNNEKVIDEKTLEELESID
jgi:ferredoxin